MRIENYTNNGNSVASNRRTTPPDPAITSSTISGSNGNTTTNVESNVNTNETTSVITFTTTAQTNQVEQNSTSPSPSVSETTATGTTPAAVVGATTSTNLTVDCSSKEGDLSKCIDTGCVYSRSGVCMTMDEYTELSTNNSFDRGLYYLPPEYKDVTMAAFTPLSGQTTSAGTTMAGTTAAGTTMAGTTAAGTTMAGTTAAGTTMAGTTAAGTTMAGTTAAGTTMAGTTAAGTTMAGTTAAGTTMAGRTAAGTTMAGTTAVGTTAVGTTAVGTTAVGTTAAGTTMAGTTMAGTTAAGTTAAGTTMAGTTAAITTNVPTTGTVTTSVPVTTSAQDVNNATGFNSNNTPMVNNGVSNGPEASNAENVNNTLMNNNSNNNSLLNNNEMTGDNANSGALKYLVFINGELQNNNNSNNNNNNNELGKYSETVVNNNSVNNRPVLDTSPNNLDNSLIVTNDDGNKYLYSPNTGELKNFKESVERKHEIKKLENRIEFLEDSLLEKTSIDFENPNNVRNKLILPIADTIDLGEEEENTEETFFVSQNFGNGEHPVVTTSVNNVSNNSYNELEVNKEELDNVIEELNSLEEEEQNLVETIVENNNVNNNEFINDLQETITLRQKLMLTVICLAVILVISFVIYYFIFKRDSN